MDLLIVADLEGISCVGQRSVCDSAHPGYGRVLENYAAEVNAVAISALRMGINRVMLLDWHGRLLPPGLLDARIETASLPLPRGRWVAMLLGFHAHTGQRDAFAPHTLCDGWRIVWNGQEAGELALASRWLGELGIPLVLVTGDRGLTREAEEWVEQTAAVTVKRALSAEVAECLPVERARVALADALGRVLVRRSWWWVYRPELPVRWDIVSPDGKHYTVESSSVAEALCRVQEVIPSATLAVRCYSETSE